MTATLNPTIISMEVVGVFADGSPIYAFHTAFPTKGVRVLPDQRAATPEGAAANGRAFVTAYERDMFPGGLGECLGIVPVQGGYAPVVNTYYSNS